MNRKEWSKLMKEAREEFREEKAERVKTFIKERMQEYEMAKATVRRIEKQFKKLKRDGFNDEAFLIEYNG